MKQVSIFIQTSFLFWKELRILMLSFCMLRTTNLSVSKLKKIYLFGKKKNSGVSNSEKVDFVKWAQYYKQLDQGAATCNHQQPPPSCIQLFARETRVCYKLTTCLALFWWNPALSGCGKIFWYYVALKKLTTVDLSVVHQHWSYPMQKVVAVWQWLKCALKVPCGWIVKLNGWMIRIKMFRSWFHKGIIKQAFSSFIRLLLFVQTLGTTDICRHVDG